MPLSPRPSSKAISTVVEDRSDPTLPVILEFQSPSTAITTAPVPRVGARHRLDHRQHVRRDPAGDGPDPGRSRGDRAGARGVAARRRWCVQPLETVDRALDRRARRPGRAGRPGAGAARSDLRRRRCRRAGGAGVHPAGPGVAAAGGSRRASRSPTAASIRTWRCRRRSSASARPSTTSSSRTTRQKINGLGVRHRQGQLRRGRLPQPARGGDQRREDAAGSGTAAGRQQAQHAGGDGQPGRDGAEPARRRGDRGQRRSAISPR